IGPCSSLAALKKAYGDRLKPNPHMLNPQDHSIVYGWTLGKHLMFIMGPVPGAPGGKQASVVETVALFGNDLATAGYVAPAECVPGTANVVARPAVAPRAVSGPALPQTVAATRFTPRLTLRTPARWTRTADGAAAFRVTAPGGRTSIEFRLDPAATSAGGVPLAGVSHSANGLSAWLHRTTALHASAPQGSRIGKPVLTVASLGLARAPQGRPYFLFRSHGTKTFWSTGRVPVRLYVTPLRVGSAVHTLAVAARSTTAKELAKAMPAIDAIVRSIHVAAVPVHEITAISAQCTQPFGGTCLGEVPPGTHTTRTFKPTLRYTVPAGWTNFNDAPGNFGFAPPGGDWGAVDAGKSDYLGVFQRIAPTGSRCGDDAAPVRSAASFVRWLEANPGVALTRLSRVTIGGLSGFVMDVRMRRSNTRTCPWSRGVPAVQLIHGVLPTNPQMIHGLLPQPFVMRLYLLDYKRATLGIEIDEIEGSSKLDAYDAVVRTFRFTTG